MCVYFVVYLALFLFILEFNFVSFLLDFFNLLYFCFVFLFYFILFWFLLYFILFLLFVLGVHFLFILLFGLDLFLVFVFIGTEIKAYLFTRLGFLIPYIFSNFSSVSSFIFFSIGFQNSKNTVLLIFCIVFFFSCFSSSTL